MFGVSIWQLAIILAIIVLIFGTKKIRSMGKDLGGALKGFKKEVSEDNDGDETPEASDVEFSEVSEEKASLSKDKTIKPRRTRVSASKSASKTTTKRKAGDTAKKKQASTRSTVKRTPKK